MCPKNRRVFSFKFLTLCGGVHLRSRSITFYATKCADRAGNGACGDGSKDLSVMLEHNLINKNGL